MASRAIVLSFEAAQGTYNDDIIISTNTAYMEGGRVITEQTPVTVGIADTTNTVSTKIATAVRARAVELGFTAISTNNVWIPGYAKG